MSSLAAARADNFYYPPGWTPDQGSLNKYQGQHPLRERAKRLSEGILIIRFEMPFNVWCAGCGAMIAKGVRFNAEKKQIGSYFSTKIWSFRMKSACCQTAIEIHSDPKNCAYVVVSGGQKKQEDFDASDAGTIQLMDDKDKLRLEADPFLRLEHSSLPPTAPPSLSPAVPSFRTKAEARSAASLIEQQLKRDSERKHGRDWERNRELRKRLRVQKSRVLEEEHHSRSLGLSLRLLPLTKEDEQRAKSVAFLPKFSANQRERRGRILSSTIFGSCYSARASVERKGVKPSDENESSSRHSGGGTSEKATDAIRNSKSSSRELTGNCGIRFTSNAGIWNSSDGNRGASHLSMASVKEEEEEEEGKETGRLEREGERGQERRKGVVHQVKKEEEKVEGEVEDEHEKLNGRNYGPRSSSTSREEGGGAREEKRKRKRMGEQEAYRQVLHMPSFGTHFDSERITNGHTPVSRSSGHFPSSSPSAPFSSSLHPVFANNSTSWSQQQLLAKARRIDGRGVVEALASSFRKCN